MEFRVTTTMVEPRRGRGGRLGWALGLANTAWLVQWPACGRAYLTALAGVPALRAGDCAQGLARTASAFAPAGQSRARLLMALATVVRHRFGGFCVQGLAAPLHNGTLGRLRGCLWLARRAVCESAAPGHRRQGGGIHHPRPQAQGYGNPLGGDVRVDDFSTLGLANTALAFAIVGLSVHSR